MQASFGVTGGVGEIGVHHGKFFIPLTILKSGEKHLAIDLFGDQHLNVDRSGKGDLEIFSRNLDTWSNLADCYIETADTLRIGAREISDLLAKVGPLSIFSVDGSHTVEHTLNDLTIAQQMVGSGGLIFIDDYLNPNWPGVQEAVARFFFFHPYKFVPLCLAFSKLVLVDISLRQKYLSRLESRLKNPNAGWRVKNVTRFGYSGFSLSKAAGERGVRGASLSAQSGELDDEIAED